MYLIALKNNVAAAMIADGNFRDVAVLLKSSLQNVATNLKMCSPDHEISNRHASNTDDHSLVYYDFLVVQDLKRHLGEQIRVADSTTFCGKEFVFCDPLLILYHSHHEASEAPYTASSTYTLPYGVILYNIALCFHLNAIASSNETTLRKALGLYARAMMVQRHGGGCHNLEQCMLAILNNMGQIHSSLENSAEAKASFSCLWSAILLCNVGSKTAHRFEGFLSNVLWFLLGEDPNTITVAPAA